ncbi:MAG TPA: PQQ-binding-like beta-propeller repeat protein [Bryobacteraceae bacterium]|nr:PQQ-binding-like beta-propeller repeat protein [Bryobacteraceae bacterium]
MRRPTSSLTTIGTSTCFFLLAPWSLAQPQARPPKTFETHCTICHGGDANGTDRAIGILPFVASHSDEELSTLVRNGRPGKGMPKFDFDDSEMKVLIGHLRGLASGAISAAGGPARGGRGGGRFQPHPATLRLQDGRTLDGTLTSSTPFSATLLTADGKFHLMTRSGDTYAERPIEPKLDWPNYDGGYSGNRYSSLAQITPANVKRLAPAWIFPVPGAPRLEVTPVVVDGVMYITAANEAYALDATTGRQIWSFRTPRTPGLLSEAGGGANRGVALSGNRVFMITDNAHLLALDRLTGRKVWDVTMGDTKQGYSATAAPLVIGDLVLSGIAGGEEGARGFVDAYRVANGERAWRFWTIPLAGEKGSETWVGNALQHGCGATWVTGSYDAALGLVYWTVGNPCPDFNGDERKGDNLYTNSVVALDVKTGIMKWYFQFTPHDTHDWDANGPLVLVDEPWEGRLRKLLVHADENGFFFVLDRTDGQLLLAAPLGKQNWTTGYGKDGRPILTDHFETTIAGTLTCQTGTQKWPSVSLDPVSKLFFVRLFEGCSAIRKDPTPPEMGQRFFGGSFGGRQGGSQSFIHAIDIHTGSKVWEYPLPNGSGSGTLATAGGLVFFGESGGTFTALDSNTGIPVWHFETGQSWRASPMSYMVGGTQYVALAGNGGVFTFALAQ